MSNLIVITAEMHKVADLPINIKYRRPGNVIGYIPVEFEIFREGEYFKAVPVETEESKRLTNLPKQLLFQYKNGSVFTFNKTGKEEVVEEIVRKLSEMKIVAFAPQKVTEEAVSGSSCIINEWISNFSKGVYLKKPIFFTIAEQKLIEVCRKKYMELNRLEEIKDFYEYERYFGKIINELTHMLSDDHLSGKIPMGRYNATATA